MTQADQLKPCAFCNGAAKITENQDLWIIDCEGDCGASIVRPLFRDEAIKAWNTRASEHSDQAAEALEFLYHLRLGTGVKIGDLIADMSAEGNPDAMRFEDMMSAYATSKGKA
jgi:hypothetical protein